MEGDDEERTAAPRKKRFDWKKPLADKFTRAITNIGLDNATPKRILEFMNEPDLTVRHVASHLQKYRKFLKELKVAEDAGDEDMRERLRRSRFALGHPEFFNNNERDQPHSQLPNQQQMGTSIGSTFQPSAGIGSTLPLTAAASNNHGSIQFPNYQQTSTSNGSRSIPKLIGSGQLSLLNNNPANFLCQQPMLGNGNGDQLFCQENRRPAAFGMQQPSNNFENEEEWKGGHARFYGGGDASASASDSGAIGGGFGNGNWDSQGYGFSYGTCYELKSDSCPKWCLTVDEEKQEKKAKRGRKRSREGDDEERTAAPRKKRFVWKKLLADKFTRAITHIVLDNATPKRILEFMNEPDLTIKHVASHLQKYRKFLMDKKVAKDEGDEDKLEKLCGSSFALGHPEFFNNNERDQPHSQLPNQQQMGTSIGSTFQPSAGIGSTLPLTAAASNNHGSIQFPNYQQTSTSNRSRSIPQLIGLRQSSLLNNNPANFLPQQPMLGNGNGDQLFCQENRRPAAFGMQQPSNNFENGGMSCGPMNNLGLTNNNIGTSNLMQVYPPQSQPRTNNPFSYNLATSVNQNGSNFTPMSSSFENSGSHFNNVNQVEVPDPAANQVPNPSADQVPNPSADQVPYPCPYHVEDNAPNGTILDPGVLTLSELDDNTWNQYLLAALELGFYI